MSTDKPPQNAIYIGDGVYASYDGFHVWLYTERSNGWCCIALEPAVLVELERLVNVVWGANQQ